MKEDVVIKKLSIVLYNLSLLSMSIKYKFVKVGECSITNSNI